MNTNLLFLALSGFRAHAARSAALCLSLSFAIFLPTFSGLAMARLGETLRHRADQTPILVGAPGDPLSLTLAALYFRGSPTTNLPFSTLQHPALAGPARAVPLALDQHAAGEPLIGTNLDYFEVRGLEIGEGRKPAQLGEIVAGAAVARKLDLHPGDTLRSDLDQVYDLSGSYPLLLRVVGVLHAKGGPDDGAFFTDIKTIWAIRGEFHGHGRPEGEALAKVERDADGQEHVLATEALFMVQDPDPSQLASFHLHGDPGGLPLSAILVFPDSPQDHDLLLGNLETAQGELQVARPPRVIDDLLAILEQGERALRILFSLILATTLLLSSTILYLSWEARRSEHRLFERLGCATGTLRRLLWTELSLLGGTALLLAAFASYLGLLLLERVLAA